MQRQSERPPGADEHAAAPCGFWRAARQRQAGIELDARVHRSAIGSRARKEPISSMVLISGARKTTVVFLSTPISTGLCRVAQLQREGWAIMMSEASRARRRAGTLPQIFARFSMIALFLLLVIVAIVLGIVGVVAKGLLYLLFIGIAVFLGALLLGALRMRRRPGKHPAR